MIVLEHSKTAPFDCPYIDNHTAVFEQLYVQHIDATEYDDLLQRGWRRFGKLFFRPVCPHCEKCISFRIPIRKFKPSRSQKRALADNQNVQLHIDIPRLDISRLRLFDDYHQFMHVEKGWPYQIHTDQDYASLFVRGNFDFALEVAYLDQKHLLGIALTDATVESLSSIYFFHEPRWRRHSPGVFSILKQIEYAHHHKIHYQYLGYWIPECPSMAYKSSFRPFEILANPRRDDEKPRWEFIDPRAARD